MVGYFLLETFWDFFWEAFFLHISLRFRFVVISLRAYKWFNLKQTLVAIHVMTGSTGHLNLLGWCDYNILLQVLSGWFCVPMVVVSGRVVVLPIGRWLELRVVVLGFSKGRGFE